MASMVRTIKRGMVFAGMNKQQRKLIKREGLTWNEFRKKQSENNDKRYSY